ncbi:MAG: hypothetical protein JSU72_18715 [Deltaproteobacteria bacterium]|nr:MAG: hypothetical protein JSU72_18715 [Deltaproteobacteria bacterium]
MIAYRWYVTALCVLVNFCACSLTLTEKEPEVSKSESQCVVCHTDAKKLIRLSWEIEKLRPKKGKSAETSGEG